MVCVKEGTPTKMSKAGCLQDQCGEQWVKSLLLHVQCSTRGAVCGHATHTSMVPSILVSSRMLHRFPLSKSCPNDPTKSGQSPTRGLVASPRLWSRHHPQKHYSRERKCGRSWKHQSLDYLLFHSPWPDSDLFFAACV